MEQVKERMNRKIKDIAYERTSYSTSIQRFQHYLTNNQRGTTDAFMEEEREVCTQFRSIVQVFCFVIWIFETWMEECCVVVVDPFFSRCKRGSWRRFWSVDVDGLDLWIRRKGQMATVWAPGLKAHTYQSFPGDQIRDLVSSGHTTPPSNCCLSNNH